VKKTLALFECRYALASLCAEPAAEFGARLLARAHGPQIPFRTFVLVARDMVAGEPEDAANWLAALVALQMCAAAEAAEAGPPPSPN
jgi:hypothetical protein